MTGSAPQPLGTGTPSFAAAIEAATGQRPARVIPLSGGCIGEIYKVELEDGARLVAKVSAAGGLAIEGFMLGYLKMHSALPVPAVLHGTDCLLLIRFSGVSKRYNVKHDGTLLP